MTEPTTILRARIADRIFVGIQPAAVTYCDKTRTIHGDYARLASLPYESLSLQFEKDCPADLRDWIEQDAAAIIAKRGQAFQISASGQTVILGGLGADERNWQPLIRLVGIAHVRDYMLMGKVGSILQFKHRCTRRYLNLDADLQTYQHTGMGMYTRIPQTEAMSHVLS